MGLIKGMQQRIPHTDFIVECGCSRRAASQSIVLCEDSVSVTSGAPRPSFTKGLWLVLQSLRH